MLFYDSAAALFLKKCCFTTVPRHFSCSSKTDLQQGCCSKRPQHSIHVIRNYYVSRFLAPVAYPKPFYFISFPPYYRIPGEVSVHVRIVPSLCMLHCERALALNPETIRFLAPSSVGQNLIVRYVMGVWMHFGSSYECVEKHCSVHRFVHYRKAPAGESVQLS